MINQIKEMKKMKTSQAVLNRLEYIQAILKGEFYKDIIGLENDYAAFEKLETIAYKIAVKKSITIEEIENCAVSVEQNYYGKYDPDEWAEQIRIKAYGIEWYLNRNFNSSAYQEFVNFIADNAKQAEGVRNV